MKLLLLDIDGTLLDSNHLGKLLQEEMHAQYGIDEQTVRRTMDLYRTTITSSIDFNPDDYLALLSKQSSVAFEKLHDLFWHTERIYHDALYADTLPFLNRIQSENYTIGIFSEGVISFQQNKLLMTGIDRFIDMSNRYIFTQKTTQAALDTIPKDAHVIDNKESIVTVLTEYGIRATHIDRPRQTLLTLTNL